MNSFIRLPATDMPGILGFAVMTILVIAIANKIPGIKTLV